MYTFEEIFGNDIENIANSYMFVPISKVENNNSYSNLIFVFNLIAIIQHENPLKISYIAHKNIHLKGKCIFERDHND